MEDETLRRFASHELLVHGVECFLGDTSKIVWIRTVMTDVFSSGSRRAELYVEGVLAARVAPYQQDDRLGLVPAQTQHLPDALGSRIAGHNIQLPGP